VQEKIRHNSLRSAFGTYSVFFWHSAKALRGWVTRALQGKVLLVMRVGRLACVAER
jgi:hypothetical protein